ncbi:hypothetical protein G1H11_20050 [Phytoactinopolyspora alkaliphila]|uniref:Uncharacterized protein n=1 Tax=Phytoactinopolyspora alkaliphila TaxID=1783498 RepID=A0A6N9YRM6_9ACTN|nr:hypothetical protein [Phytoactinopolyspora alkaliphila]NED97595.1 hypothetical protein [Phytoactinopolyspora alkaliphila]
MSDESTTRGEQAAEPSENEYREYLAQLRSVPADRIVLETMSGVLTAAQAKIGRNDARLMIDLSALMLDHARQYLPAQQAQQFDQVLGQLRMAQVQGEQAVAQRGAPEENDLPRPPAPPATATGAAAQPAQSQQPSPASKLWVPGR